MLPYYSMSEVGSSSRVLAAKRLGYERKQRSVEDEESLKYYTKLEAVAASILSDEGYEVEEGGLCEKCGRYGIHVNINTPLFNLVGHMDRKIKTLDNRSIPVEIKCLGKASWGDFTKEPFGKYPEYISQELCYLEACQSPGVYWVMNRDTGKVARYIVNDFNNSLTPKTLKHADKFTRIELPFKFDAIIDKLNLVEIAIAEKQLPECDGGNCIWCGYSYLCETEVKKGAKSPKELTLPSLVQAANDYKAYKEYTELSESYKTKAIQTFVEYSVNNSTDKFNVNGLSFSYRGKKQRKFLDETKVKEFVKNEKKFNELFKLSQPYDDYSVRLTE